MSLRGPGFDLRHKPDDVMAQTKQTKATVAFMGFGLAAGIGLCRSASSSAIWIVVRLFS